MKDPGGKEQGPERYLGNSRDSQYPKSVEPRVSQGTKGKLKPRAVGESPHVWGREVCGLGRGLKAQGFPESGGEALDSQQPGETEICFWDNSHHHISLTPPHSG